MRLPAVGKIEDVAELDYEPVTIPIIGYTQKKKEVETDIDFVGSVPAGAIMDIISASDKNGNVNHVAALKYVDTCVHPDNREKWDALIHGATVNVSTDTIIEVYVKLGEYYANRPFKQRSGSRSGRGNSSTTTRGAAKSRVSTKTVSA